jgi:type I site-specific restriction endonuclease
MIRTENLDESGREFAKELIKGRLIEIAKLSNMDVTIKHVLKSTKTDTSYQKYIVFFSNFSRMRNDKANVRKWFETAFPKHKINEIIISSETQENSKNVSKLSSFTPKNNHIDLIYTCEMLNMGYHVSDLTGIIMYRSTYSNTIYSQQLGRVLSSGDTVPKLVLDVVDNLHRKSMYMMLGDSNNVHPVMTEDEVAEYKELIIRTRDKDELGRPIPLTEYEQKRLTELSRLYKQVKDIQSGKVGGNTLYKEDLNLVTTVYEGTYREIIAKTVAEVVSMRCRQAWARWIERGGDASVMTREYILGQVAPQAVPLPPFCRLKNVSVNAVLDEMGVY